MPDDNIGVIICLGDNIDNNFCQNGNIVWTGGW
jgi:hypothetical protein